MVDSAFVSGQLVDRRYRLVREIARGGAAVIVEANQIFSGRRVALKFIREDETGEVAKARMLREAHALEAARHTGVVALLDACADVDRGPYLAMELLEGRTLAGILTSRGAIPVRDVVCVGVQLCEALAAAHDRGLVHRDVKPSNALIAHTGMEGEEVKLLDFGIARFLRPQQDGAEIADRKLTKQDEILGTPEYMAPERLLSKGSDDHLVDIYSLGVVLYECLVGAVPFEGNFGEVLLKVSTTTPRPPLEIRSEVSRRLNDVILRCLANRPEDRFPNMRALAAALRHALPDIPERTQLLGIRAKANAREATVEPPEQPQPKTVSLVPRRRFARAPYLTPVRIVRSEGTYLDGNSEDISEGGMLVRTPRPCNNEERVEVRFALPIQGSIVRLAASSRWVRPGRRSGANGLEFVDVPEDVRNEIRVYVRAMGGESD